MFQILTFYHSIMRWLVLASIVYGIYRAYRGYSSNGIFSPTDNAVRHWTATIVHIQLIIGFILYIQSPITKHFWKNINEAVKSLDLIFFGLLHLILMLTAIIVVTIGSALSKRKKDDKEKFKTMLVWFSVALIIIFIAIPWPFSPFATRPYFR